MTKMIDLTGRTFGKLTVLERADNMKPGVTMWRCKCECGSITVKRSRLLVRGETRSCGCRTGVDHTIKIGTVVNNYTVVAGPLRHAGRKSWQCRCKCGVIKLISDHRLSRPKHKAISCGCASYGTHGESDSKLYGIWESMKGRCYTKGHSSYKNYGARGIGVSDEWVNDYEAFRDWALKEGYESSTDRAILQLDRVDGEGDYGPDNCRFVSQRDNLINKRLRPENNSNNFTGVHLSCGSVDRGKPIWYAQITIQGKVKNICGFLCPVSAAVARDLEIIRLGLGYNLNFPQLLEGDCEEVIRDIINSTTIEEYKNVHK